MTTTPAGDSNSAQNPGSGSGDQAVEVKFDPAAAHMNTPRIRPVRGFPVTAKAPDGAEHQMLGLADARQVSDRMVVAMPGFAHVLQQMDGSRNVDTLLAQIGRGLTRPALEGFIAQLDGAGLIEGPTFRNMLQKMHDEFDSQAVLPPGTTAQFTDALLANDPESPTDEPARSQHAAKLLRNTFDQYIAEALKDAADPAFTTLPKAIVAPHLDYPRGGLNYASVYGRLRVADRPDRIIILGTNHFGEATGICACDKGFSTALGACEVDTALVAALRAALGDKLFAHRFDHEREHSIELQVAWIQHVFGTGADGKYPPVFAALIHDPATANGESYDGKGVALQPFVDAMKTAIAKLPGRTLIVASADLSHVGPAFGDQQMLIGDGEAAEPAEQFRNAVFRADDEALGLVVNNKPAELVASMAWQQNPTRWCSLGNLVATLLIVEPKEIKLLRYGPVMDPQGQGMVTSVAMVMG
ncbi:hypothetical protein BH11PLA1_BH11PLA1_16400 [soil metagenome]